METVIWYAEITGDYIAQMLPCAAGAATVFFLLLPGRRKRLAAKGLTSGIWREGALFLFTLIFAGLAGLTLFPAGFWTWSHWSAFFQGTEPLFQSVDYRVQLQNIQWIPFREIAGAFTGPWRFFMFLGNGAMFLPLGFFPALLWRGENWKLSLLIGLCFSTCVEFVQFFIGRGSDIDDILLNTFGALCGWWIYLLLRRLAPGIVEKFKCIEVESLHERTAGDSSAPG